MVDDGHFVRTTVTITFADVDGKTLMTIRQTGFDREEDRDGIQDGWPSILDALQRVVAANQAENQRGAAR